MTSITAIEDITNIEVANQGITVQAAKELVTVITVAKQGATGAAGSKAYKNVTESQDIDSSDTNTNFSNEGATELCNLSITDNVVGTVFSLTVTDVLGMGFIFGAGVSLISSGETLTSIQSTQIGAVITISCLTPTKWIVEIQQRVWR